MEDDSSSNIPEASAFVEDGVPVASAVSDSSGSFRLDGSKPWYMFGQGTVSSEGPVWVPDEMSPQCMSCRTPFTFFNRRHHCRYCGACVCGSCSNQSLLLPPNFGVREPQRVCSSCKIVLEPMQDSLAASMSNATRQLDEEGDAVKTMLANPLSFSMSAEIRKACQSVKSFFSDREQAILNDQYIPAMLLRQAKGLCFLTVVKAGFVFSGRFGTGIVIGKDRQGSWTAPSAIGLAGVGWGAQIGGEVTTFVIILNTESAVDAFSGQAQVSIGSQIAVAAGPLGRTGEANFTVGDGGGAPCFSYSQSKGLFAGVSLEGAVLSERADVNFRFYGKHYDPKEILSGRVQRPQAAAPLYEALRIACNRDLPSSGHADTTVGTAGGLDI